MRVLALTWKHPDDPTAGGAERYLVEVCRRWADWGHAVTVLGPRADPRAPLTGSIRLEGVEYLGAGSRLTVFGAARRYLRANADRYDSVLETVSTRPFAAHRVVGGKAVALYHQTAEEVWNLEFPLPIALFGRHLLEPMWVRRMRGVRVVANSPSTAAALARFGVNCVAVVPPGCDLSPSPLTRSGPSPEPRLLWIGRFVRTKRPRDAIAALALVRARIPSATLDMVGSGYLQARLAATAAPGVTFHGQLPDADKRRLLARADLLLLPGTREGWGIVALEAAAFGVPAVAYDIPGLRDAVVGGVTGVLVAPNPGALAAGACQLLTDPSLWRRLSEASSTRAMQHSWDRCARELLECLPARPDRTWSEPASPSLPLAGTTRAAVEAADPRATTISGEREGAFPQPCAVGPGDREASGEVDDA